MSDEDHTRHLAPDFEVISKDDALLIDVVKALAASMAQHKAGVLALAIEAVQIGHSLGSALAIAQGKFEQGAFDLLCESASIDRAESATLIRLSRNYTLDDVRLRSDPQRQMMFALGCVPAKEVIEHEGNEAVNIPPGIGSAVNAWSKYMRAVDTGRATFNKGIVKNKTKELFEWLSSIHSEAEE